ncbi:MAG TPA: serine/threonine-protein kinase, partial [Myxococcaceae bacterium]|nr:serine/threonine-protein kinase [Myxococcaceae bacterium]
MTEEGWPRRCGHFELLSLLGQGGMAEVYLARFALGPQKGQLVALKRVRRERLRDAEVLAQVRQEALLTRRMDHPNVVRLVEAGELQDGSYYLALELVEGTDLGKLLAECRRRRIELPVDISVYVVRQVLEGLSHAHLATNEAGLPLALVHCDVSPSNVLLSHEGEVKLSDFGVAWRRGGTTVDVRRLGKGYYRSPELLEGKVSDAVDLWATAVMLYELLTRESPF